MIIAFEGHNGVGKSTVAKNFSNITKGKFLYGVDEESLENGLKEKFIMDAKWYPSALHFIAGTMETKRKIDEIYKKKLIVLDRSYWSTLAVIWDKPFKDRNKILNIFYAGEEFLPIPDILFILTASYEKCNERIANKKAFDKKLDSVVDRKYYDKEMSFYNWLLLNKHEKTEICKIDTTELREEEVLNICMKKYKELRSSQ